MDEQTNSIIAEAEEVVHRYLELIEADVESREAQRSGRFVCSCPNCRAQRRETLEWVQTIHHHNAEPRPA